MFCKNVKKETHVKGTAWIRCLPKYTIKNDVFYSDSFSKPDQIRRKLRIWSHLLKKFLMEYFIFWAVVINHNKIYLPFSVMRCCKEYLKHIRILVNIQEQTSSVLLVRTTVTKVYYSPFTYYDGSFTHFSLVLH